MSKKLNLYLAALVALIIGLAGGFALANWLENNETPDNPIVTEPAGYIGLSETDAVAKAEYKDQVYRIVRRDNDLFPVTQDYQPNRVNFEIDNGIVTKAEFY